MTVTVTSQTAGGWGISAVLMNSRGKVLHTTAMYAGGNWTGALGAALTYAKLRGWKVSGRPL